MGYGWISFYVTLSSQSRSLSGKKIITWWFMEFHLLFCVLFFDTFGILHAHTSVWSVFLHNLFFFEFFTFKTIIYRPICRLFSAAE